MKIEDLVLDTEAVCEVCSSPIIVGDWQILHEDFLEIAQGLHIDEIDVLCENCELAKSELPEVFGELEWKIFCETLDDDS